MSTALWFPVDAFGHALKLFLDELPMRPGHVSSVHVERLPDLWGETLRIDEYESPTRGRQVSVILRSGYLSVCQQVPVADDAAMGQAA